MPAVHGSTGLARACRLWGRLVVSRACACTCSGSNVRAAAQDPITNPAEYNNLGRSAAQPQSVTLSDAFTASANLVDNGDGTFTATINSAFPPGAIMRAVGLQGYYQINVNSILYSLHTPSTVIVVTGDARRREVVESNNCAKCHELFEGHGGNRVLNMEICLLCHVPNLSSSGRGITTPNADIVAQLGPGPLTYPEATQNMKEMIHGIHASSIRTTDYEHVRNRNNGIY